MSEYDYDDPDDDVDWQDDDDETISRKMFASGGSALRRASKRNPRNLPCPTCGRPNMLTPADRANGYQCDRCADQAERGY